jgi:hypothetical protein
MIYFQRKNASTLYAKAKAYLSEHRIKVVFNLLDGSHLLNQIGTNQKLPERCRDYQASV